MPDLTFLKPITDLQYLILVAGIVFLLLRVWGKKPKFLLSSLSPENSKDGDLCEVSGKTECKQEGILEGILKKLSSLGSDVEALKTQVQSDSRINEERHDLIQSQLTAMFGRIDQLYSILLSQRNQG